MIFGSEQDVFLNEKVHMRYKTKRGCSSKQIFNQLRTQNPELRTQNPELRTQELATPNIESNVAVEQYETPSCATNLYINKTKRLYINLSTFCTASQQKIIRN